MRAATTARFLSCPSWCERGQLAVEGYQQRCGHPARALQPKATPLEFTCMYIAGYPAAVVSHEDALKELNGTRSVHSIACRLDVRLKPTDTTHKVPWLS